MEPEDPRDRGLELIGSPNTERALRRLVRRCGGPEGLAVCYEAGPCGYAPHRLLSEMGVACDVIAPSLTPRQRAQAELVPAEVLARAWRTQVRLNARHRSLTARGKQSTVAKVAVARELTGFIWAAMTQQPLREEVAAS